jgi:replicative DNA helicase
MGKTAFVLSMARNMAVDYQIPVAIFSLEMSSIQLVQRLISAEAEIEADKLRKGELAEYQMHQLHQRITKISDAPIFIDDTPALSIFELRAKCRRLKAQHGIQAVIIDYLQLMSAGLDNKNGNREQEISTISRNIKSIAKELEIPIIALSQLSRQVETRSGDKKPILSDLRESGAIEQDADIVAFLYRPEYYKLTEEEIGGRPVNGMAYVIVAKHRNGALAEIPLRFINTFAKFTNQDGFAGELPEGFSQVSPNAGFLENNGKTTITISSKMNTLDDEDDDSPFSYGKKDVDF